MQIFELKSRFSIRDYGLEIKTTDPYRPVVLVVDVFVDVLLADGEGLC